MKSSRYIIIHKHRTAEQRPSHPISFLKVLGLSVLALMMIILTGAGLAYAIFSQSLPSLELFRTVYEHRPDPTSFYARDGETLLFSLAYEDFAPHDLKLCPADGEGCFPQKFLDAARLTRETAAARHEGYSLTEEINLWLV